MAKKKAFAWSPVRDLMKGQGASMVARDAVDLMISVMEDKVKACTTEALRLTHHRKQTKVTKADLELAMKESKDCKLL